MKTNHIFGYIWIGIAVVLTLGLIAGITNSKKNRKYFNSGITISDLGKYTLTDTMSFSTSKVNSIKIDLLSEAVFLEESDENSIVVELYGSSTNVPKVELKNGVLLIKSYNKISIMEPKRKVVVKIPSDFNSSAVTIDSASGSIHLIDCSFSDAIINCSSGSIRIDDCAIDTLNIKSTSGSVHIDDCSIRDCVVNSTSGSIKASGNFEGIDLHAVSGSIHAELEDPLLNNSEINTTSGSIHLDIPDSSNLQINYSVSSGNYRNNISGAQGKKGSDFLGNGGPSLNLKTTSGSININ